MKILLVLFVLLLGTTPVLAQPSATCIDPHYGYQARYLAGHDIVAKATFGHDHRELKLSTTCIALHTAQYISLSSDFNCVGKGDTVVTSTIDGQRQSCRITHIEPYVPAAAPDHS